MTKVEELREDIFRRMEAIPYGDHSIIAGLKMLNVEGQVDSLIAAARAEGAEQEAAKVVHCGECASAKPYPDEPMVECRFGCDRPIDGFCSLGTLLAPATKSVPSATVTNHDGPVTSTDCSIENAGYVQTSDKEPK